MFPFFAISLLSAAAAAALGIPDVPSVKVKESVNSPRGWTQQMRAPGDHIIELKIALPQPNFGVLEKHLYEISDPFHDRYGQHLSKEEVTKVLIE